MSKDLIKGKGLILVTGKKGSGKSHFVTSQIKYIVDNYPEHKIYADIDGLSIDGVEQSPQDWQTAEKNSTIVYDEAQRLSWCDNSSTKINSDPRVREMTMIRHENKNIVLITQDPTFIHSALRKLVDVHYHFSHPFKDGKPKCFVFHGAMSTIDDKGYYKAHAVEEFTYHLDKDTAKLYKSVDDDAQHDQKKKYPKKIIWMIIFAVLLVLLAIPLGIYGIKTVFGFIFSSQERSMEIMHGKPQEKTEQTESKVSDGVQSAMTNGITSATSASALSDMSQRCRLPEYVQTTECIQWFDSVAYSSADKPIQYDINNPHDFDTSQYRYEIRDVPIIAGCAIDPNNKCTCYTQQMTKLKISNKDCRRYVAGDKPFNPFYERNQVQDTSQANTPTTTTQQPQETQSKIINAGDNKGYFDTENAPLMGITAK